MYTYLSLSLYIYIYTFGLDLFYSLFFLLLALQRSTWPGPPNAPLRAKRSMPQGFCYYYSRVLLLLLLLLFTDLASNYMSRG